MTDKPEGQHPPNTSGSSPMSGDCENSLDTLETKLALLQQQVADLARVVNSLFRHSVLHYGSTIQGLNEEIFQHGSE